MIESLNNPLREEWSDTGVAKEVAVIVIRDGDRGDIWPFLWFGQCSYFVRSGTIMERSCFFVLLRHDLADVVL